MAYILVVDDHADTRDSLCGYLRKFGHDSAPAGNGEEAITSILDRLPDVIVLDLYMPHMDGTGLLEVLQSYSRLQSIPVIVWTAYPNSSMVDRAQHLGVTNIFAKGTASFDDILSAIHRHLPLPPEQRESASDSGIWN